MPKTYFLTILLALSTAQAVFSQKPSQYRWWNPAENNFPVIQGQAWPKEVAEFYDRLPARARKDVSQSVWERSEDAACLTIRFHTDATAIRVRYTVSHDLNRPHITTTGKSGLDLYAADKNGKWLWSPGFYKFGDTIEYRYNPLQRDLSREYCLYLPYYNHVNWMEIGVPETAVMKPSPIRSGKPIVIYGTSIAQGTAAPRPGLTWVAILERRLSMPVINLGFAGCGRLDPPIISLMAELDARVYVLDCLPNLGRADVIKERLFNAVQILQQKRPDIPILIVDHADAHVVSMNTAQHERYNRVNEASRETFHRLKSSGVKNIYYLSADSIGLSPEDMAIDGVHPNAKGMESYAKAYEKAIRQIFY